MIDKTAADPWQEGDEYVCWANQGAVGSKSGKG